MEGKPYYDNNELVITYNSRMDGYWLALKTKDESGVMTDFIKKRDFQYLQNSDDFGKISKLKTLDSPLYLGIKGSNISYTTLCNAIEIVKLKEEKELEEFNKANNL